MQRLVLVDVQRRRKAARGGGVVGGQEAGAAQDGHARGGAHAQGGLQDVAPPLLHPLLHERRDLALPQPLALHPRLGLVRVRHDTNEQVEQEQGDEGPHEEVDGHDGARRGFVEDLELLRGGHGKQLLEGGDDGAKVGRLAAHRHVVRDGEGEREAHKHGGVQHDGHVLDGEDDGQQDGAPAGDELRVLDEAEDEEVEEDGHEVDLGAQLATHAPHVKEPPRGSEVHAQAARRRQHREVDEQDEQEERPRHALVHVPPVAQPLAEAAALRLLRQHHQLQHQLQAQHALKRDGGPKPAVVQLGGAHLHRRHHAAKVGEVRKQAHGGKGVERRVVHREVDGQRVHVVALPRRRAGAGAVRVHHRAPRRHVPRVQVPVLALRRVCRHGGLVRHRRVDLHVVNGRPHLVRRHARRHRHAGNVRGRAAVAHRQQRAPHAHRAHHDAVGNHHGRHGGGVFRVGGLKRGRRGGGVARHDHLCRGAVGHHRRVR